MAIDVGSACSARANYLGGQTTVIDRNNPANATGTIDSVCVYAYSDPQQLNSPEFASFIDEGSNTFSTRGNVSVADQTSNPQTYTAPGDFTVFDINNGDYIGLTFVSGIIEVTEGSGDGFWTTIVSDNIPASSVTFAFTDLREISIYATGTESGVGVVPQNIMMMGIG